ESWSTFLGHGKVTSPALVEATAATVKPADIAVLFFSSGSTSRPKGVFSNHRAVTLTLWRWKRVFNLGDDVRSWTANGWFWSGNFGMSLGGTLTSGGTLIVQRVFDAEEALQLIQDEKVTHPMAWPHQEAQLIAAPNYSKVNLSSVKYWDCNRPLAKHPTIKTTWEE